MRTRIGASLALALAMVATGGVVRVDAQGAWTPPACSTVTGTPAVTFTRDDGRTLAPTSEPLHGVAYTIGLATLDTPNTLVAEHDGTILRSTDAGCTWTAFGTAPDFPLTITAAPGGRAYGWTDNGDKLVLIDAGGVTKLTSPSDAISGLGVDRADGTHLRLGGGDGIVWDSTDGGQRWTAVGIPPVSDGDLLLYRVAFDPQNLDHVVAGTATTGLFVSTNGGASWRQATGFSANGRANVFAAVISPADGNVVWAMGLDFAELDSGASSEGRHIYRSVDGGQTFKPVVRQNRKVTLVNGPVMVAHPTKPAILYFVFGTYFQGYGTDLFKYNARTGRLTKSHNGYDDVSSIAFSPADPSVMYLGLTVEEINGLTERRST